MLIDVNRSGMNRAECGAVCEEMRDLVLDLHTRLSVFEYQSIVSRLNRANADEAIMIDNDLLCLVKLCEQLRITTQGTFDIAAGTLMDVHGFRHQSVDIQGLSLGNSLVLDESHGTIRKSDDRISIDFGAIAKGYALDLVHEEMLELGIQRAFVHGGTSSSLGLGQGWSVEVGNGMRIALDGLSMGVSEIGSRSISTGDSKIGHVMDPRTMRPASHSAERVICVHSSAAIADAYSTACSVDPDLVHHLDDKSCTLIVFDTVSEPIVHDPLGVVRQIQEDAT